MNVLSFAQHPKAGLIYDRRAAVTLHVVDDRLVSYSQTYLAKLSVLRDRLNLMSEQDAVITLYRDNDIPNNSAIVSTKLAYSYLLDAKGARYTCQRGISVLKTVQPAM